MKKVTTLALVALLAVAGAAFAGERFAGIEANATFATGSPATTNNDDSCDIGVAPAATLLLPYFEVDIVNTAGTGETTLFAITNTSRDPQIAHVTLWTDWSFPVLDFNIFLTGYDVQTINLYDIIVRGVVAPQTGTRTDTVLGVRGGTGAASTTRSAENDSRVELINLNTCPQLPGQLPDVLVRAVRAALTTGLYQIPAANFGCGTSGTTKVGGTHANAVGYLTIDVINNPCSTALPTSYSYFSTEILFDNVLVGDFQQVNGDTVTGNYAQGNPMVHIRAIPEGGNVGFQPTNLPSTFYDRYTTQTTPAITLAQRKVDRRQPLPSTFAARWIEGGPGAFNTSYKIWREGVTGGTQTCDGAASNSALPIREIVRFDERENWAVTSTNTTICSPFCTTPTVGIPETSNIPTSNTSVYPAKFGADLSGWMYLNLHNNYAGTPGVAASFSTARASQNWVIVSMKAEGRYSVDFDAAWLGNGCSAVMNGSTLDATNPIAPARNIP